MCPSIFYWLFFFLPPSLFVLFSQAGAFLCRVFRGPLACYWNIPCWNTLSNRLLSIFSLSRYWFWIGFVEFHWVLPKLTGRRTHCTAISLFLSPSSHLHGRQPKIVKSIFISIRIDLSLLRLSYWTPFQYKSHFLLDDRNVCVCVSFIKWSAVAWRWSFLVGWRDSPWRTGRQATGKKNRKRPEGKQDRSRCHIIITGHSPTPSCALRVLLSDMSNNCSSPKSHKEIEWTRVKGSSLTRGRRVLRI